MDGLISGGGLKPGGLRSGILRYCFNCFEKLRSFPCFAVRSSSAHEGKIIIFERFHCSLTKIIQLT